MTLAIEQGTSNKIKHYMQIDSILHFKKKREKNICLSCTGRWSGWPVSPCKLSTLVSKEYNSIYCLVKIFENEMLHNPLKVPKRENFSLAFFALSEPIWACDLGTGEKNRIFYQVTPDFNGFWSFAAY